MNFPSLSSFTATPSMDIWAWGSELPLISSSDAHWLDWIGSVMTIFELGGPPTVVELRCALQQQDGRRAYVP